MTPQDIDTRLKDLFREVPDDDPEGGLAYIYARDVLVCHSDADEADILRAQEAVRGRWSVVADCLPEAYGTAEPTPPEPPRPDPELKPEERDKLVDLFRDDGATEEPAQVSAIRQELHDLTSHIDEEDYVAAMTLYGQVMTVLVANITPETAAEARYRDRARATLRYGDIFVANLAAEAIKTQDEDVADPSAETEMFSCCGHMVLPCPFCGSRDLDVQGDGEGGVQVSCCREGCAAIGPGSCNDVRQDNIQAWNTRWNGGGQIDLEPTWVRSGREVSK